LQNQNKEINLRRLNTKIITTNNSINNYNVDHPTTNTSTKAINTIKFKFIIPDFSSLEKRFRASRLYMLIKRKIFKLLHPNEIIKVINEIECHRLILIKRHKLFLEIMQSSNIFLI